MDTSRVFSASDSASDSSGEALRGRRGGAAAQGLSRSAAGALGGLGTRSGVQSLALGSSWRNSEMEGKGRMVPGLSASRRWSTRTATTAAGGAGAAATGGGGAGVGGTPGGVAGGNAAGCETKALGEVTLICGKRSAGEKHTG